MPTADLKQYREEVEAGLPNEIRHMDAALERQAFYDYEGARYERRFRRDAESSFDFQGRSHRQSGFLWECVGKLCSHLYCPGPARRWSENSGDEFLQKVWQDNLINSIMFECDKLATLNDCVAIQIDAGEGDFEQKPITYRVWRREQIAVWCDPDEPTIPVVVVTKDIYDEQTRYRLWNDEEVWTFLTRKQPPSAGGGQPTSDGRVAYLEDQQDHEYGCLPFSFIHYELPICSFWGVAVGEFLFKAELTIDDRLMTMDESIKKYINPIPIAKGVDELWKPNIEPGRFIRLPRANPMMTDSGYQPGEFATLEYLQATIDVASAWDDLERYINQALEAADIPKSSVRMEQMGVSSGISLMIEQEPLIKRAEGRRTTFTVFENDLGKRTLWCAGNHYGKVELVRDGEKGQLAAGWPSSRISVLTQDTLDVEKAKVESGVQSHLMMIQNIYGFGREDAIEHIKQVQEDTQELEKLFPEMAKATALPDPEQEHQQALEQIEASKKE